MSQTADLIDKLIAAIDFVSATTTTTSSRDTTTTTSTVATTMQKQPQRQEAKNVDDVKEPTTETKTKPTYVVPHEYANNETAEITFREANIPGFGYWMHLNNIHYVGKSIYQDIKIIESPALGKSLVLDSKIQSSTVDEFIYHESLVHPSMILFDGVVENVFIGGGGEFATARELLKYASIKQVVMCDLDEQVVDACKKHLVEMSKDCWKDDRLKIIYGDARQYLLNTKEVFDIIIMDIADPIEAGPGIACYFKDFYVELAKKMTDNGLFVTQSGGSDYLLYTECFSVIHNTVKESFKDCLGYSVHVPSFGSAWGFNIGFKNGVPEYAMNSQKIDERICKIFNVKDVDDSPLKFYDGITHTRLFSLPKFVRKALKEETRVMSKDSRVFAY